MSANNVSTFDVFTEKNKNEFYVVDLRSDTISRPTLKMRQAMAQAIVGDDVYGEDPTVNELEKISAEIFQKEAALFVPSGTMANLLSVMVHCSRRGTEAIVGDLSHAFLYEQGGASHIAGVHIRTIKNEKNGTFSLEEFKQKIRSYDQHEPITALVIVENTHNMCGGKVIPLEWIEELSKICKENQIIMHMDGARIFNAIEALKVTPDKIAKHFSSLCFCLSKGLSAPVGSILVGSESFIKEARRLRKALGGGMRQVGILAAAGLVALKEIVPQLSEHHRRTYKLAKAIDNLKSSNIQVDLATVQTNILLIHITNKRILASDLAKRLVEVSNKEKTAGVCDDNGRGIIVKVSSRDWEFARAVIYHDISDTDIDLSIKKFNYVIQEFDELFPR
ncbi:uncharacterized protein LOC129611806 [Condylostylus longicornis]|uniref:uncharacterized protein LOC129611806 n=1 Tax=Condylostylus longicornis TaxID=2530218 RepID=UPI00244DEA9B|nr:uncharacterized protein LOC129611806 [Condylostylus longicornis]